MGDRNYFLTSPVDEIYPGLKVNLVENIQVSSGKATVKDLRMEYTTSDTNAAFSFGMRVSIPLELKGVQQTLSFWMSDS
jgi:hypothetical protein